jgi:1-phosphofructokinase family hexose kinase
MGVIYTLTLNPAVDRELTVPVIEFNTVLRATAWQVDFGGKGFNVSRLLSALGTPNVALGFAGGRSGELLRDGLESLGIQTDFIWIDQETRTNVSIVSQAQGRQIKANEPGPQISATYQEALVRAVRQKAKPGDWWVLAGSLPPGVPATFYADLIEILQSAGAFAILDTSGDALSAGCRARPYLVKPNDLETQMLTGLPVDTIDDIAAAAQAVRRMGIAHVAISRGKKGALLAEPHGLWAAASPEVKELNPIGAGDSMVGGLVWGMAQGLPPEEALRWGVACGAAAASLSGTEVGSRAAVEALLPQTDVQPLFPAM